MAVVRCGKGFVVVDASINLVAADRIFRFGISQQ
jgi:hypothetical protein